ncbi:nucleoside-diphosphate sugar epimerase/dehydratase [Sphingomonas sp.]|jgi:FlaA1/EpsC-like NDP-sugar epimerase|uniref:polysaccharide biosynthesis protein n=1 Tax=Sphingomonas sp. TaxID=28214 RepID=UPI002DF501DD|nr:nucleoside-diphosphate sugar epimerase/dehydratase [Sphingomonas sp.]
MATGQDAFFSTLRYLLSLSRKHKRLIVMSIDGVLCCAAAMAAFALRLGEWNGLTQPIQLYVLAALAVWFPVFQLRGVYRAIFRYAGSRTMVALAYATGIMAIPLVALFMFISIPGVPRTIAVIHSLLFLALLCLSRIVSRYLLVDLLAQQSFRGVQRNVLIYGAGAAGRQLASSMQMEPSMYLCGFIDDDVRLDGQRLDGHHVFHSGRMADVVARFDVKAVLLALPNIGRAARKRIISELELLSVQVQTLPNVKQILDGRVSVNDLQEVRIEDLLGRDPVAPNELLLGRTIRGKSVLVTGAGGSIGSELCRQIIRLAPRQLTLVENSEYALYAIQQELEDTLSREALSIQVAAELCDVTDAIRVRSVLSSHRPDTVFHAAAYKHVPIVEANPTAGLRNNVLGTLTMAQAAEQAGVSRFILISTDKAVRPTNVMGATKRVAELVLQGLAERGSTTKFAMVRFGNVLGSSGSVVPRFDKQIRDGGPVTITHPEVTRYFMTIPEAAQLVIQAGAMASGGEVYVLDMGESVRILDLARSMIRLSGLSIRDPANPDGDIEIRIVGLRPGEKLYEELLIGENPEPTRHERIMQAREKCLAWSELEPHLHSLRTAIETVDVGGSLHILRHLVPEFAPAAPDQARQTA